MTEAFTPAVLHGMALLTGITIVWFILVALAAELVKWTLEQ